MLSDFPHQHVSFTFEALILKGLSGSVGLYFGEPDAALLTAVPLSASSTALDLKQRPGMRRKRKEEAGVHHETSTKSTCGIWKMILTPPWWIVVVVLTGKRG